MSLNNIELNPRLLEELYSKLLISEVEGDARAMAASEAELQVHEPEAPALTTAAGLKHDFKFLGQNLKNVLVSVNYTDSTHLPDAQLDFLTNLLKACALSLSDVAIINMNNYYSIDYSQILAYFKSRTVLLFGMTALEFGFPFEIPEYQVQRFADRTVIHAAALHSIHDDKEAKGRLWTGLKKIFTV